MDLKTLFRGLESRLVFFILACALAVGVGLAFTRLYRVPEPPEVSEVLMVSLAAIVYAGVSSAMPSRRSGAGVALGLALACLLGLIEAPRKEVPGLLGLAGAGVGTALACFLIGFYKPRSAAQKAASPGAKP